MKTKTLAPAPALPLLRNCVLRFFYGDAPEKVDVIHVYYLALGEDGEIAQLADRLLTALHEYSATVSPTGEMKRVHLNMLRWYTLGMGNHPHKRLSDDPEMESHSFLKDDGNEEERTRGIAFELPKSTLYKNLPVEAIKEAVSKVFLSHEDLLEIQRAYIQRYAAWLSNPKNVNEFDHVFPLYEKLVHIQA